MHQYPKKQLSGLCPLCGLTHIYQYSKKKVSGFVFGKFAMDASILKGQCFVFLVLVSQMYQRTGQQIMFWMTFHSCTFYCVFSSICENIFVIIIRTLIHILYC